VRRARVMVCTYNDGSQVVYIKYHAFVWRCYSRYGGRWTLAPECDNTWPKLSYKNLKSGAGKVQFGAFWYSQEDVNAINHH